MSRRNRPWCLEAALLAPGFCVFVGGNVGVGTSVKDSGLQLGQVTAVEAAGCLFLTTSFVVKATNCHLLAGI